MKVTKLAMTVAATVGLVAVFGCERQGSVKTDQEKASYAIGLQIGKSLKAQGADVVLPSLELGLNDGLNGHEEKLKPEELKAAMQKMQEAVMKKQQDMAQKTEQEGNEWLEKNKSNAGWKVTPSGLQYMVVQEGKGAMPTDNDMVKVDYTGTLINGEKFDSSVDRHQPAEFPVKGVIPGWTEALKLMKQGAKYKLAIPAKLAYGPQGRPGIPANSVLLFDVDLLEVKPAPAAPAGKAGMPGMAAAKPAKPGKNGKK